MHDNKFYKQGTREKQNIRLFFNKINKKIVAISKKV